MSLNEIESESATEKRSANVKELVPKRDWRDCPDCGTPMEKKGGTGSGLIIDRALWQCPNCKNVELL
jgi:hypothetical protein